MGARLKRNTPLKRKTPLSRGNKNHAIRCEYDGYQWDSKGERDRYIHLKLLERAGEIMGLIVKPKVVLIAKRGKAPEIAYKPDFVYEEDGRRVWEDFHPRDFNTRDTIIFKLWQHYGPGLLLLTERSGKGFKTRRTVMAEVNNNLSGGR